MTRLLVVDDEKDSTFVFASILEAEGYVVDAYSDPIKALSAYKPGHYDLIILDYRMDGLNGLAFIQKVRKVDPLAKAILITAWQPQTIGKGLQDWFIKVLAKPLPQEKLLEEVTHALNQDKLKTQSLK